MRFALQLTSIYFRSDKIGNQLKRQKNTQRNNCYLFILFTIQIIKDDLPHQLLRHKYTNLSHRLALFPVLLQYKRGRRITKQNIQTHCMYIWRTHPCCWWRYNNVGFTPFVCGSAGWRFRIAPAIVGRIGGPHQHELAGKRALLNIYT